MPTVQRNKLWVAAHCDPAGGPRAGKSNVGLSRAAIMVIGQDDIERVFILEPFIQRVPPDRLIDRMCDMNEKYRPAVFGIDSTGPQLQFAQLVQKEIRERGIKLPLRFNTQRMDKTFSIESTLQPLIASGRLFRPPDNECRTLKDEFDQFPAGPYRDGMDALACAVRLLPAVLPAHLRAMSEGQLRSYLTRTGMPKDQIEERIAQRNNGNIGANP